ncbi:MAG: riboflavin synthase [Deltaproteobacteria bacterium]|nr:riboflavin synthase [Deltaproteobacteria bacterium]
MFTGLIEGMGRVHAWHKQAEFARLELVANLGDDVPPQLGDSIAVNGCCLTVVACAPATDGWLLAFELSHETLALTAFGKLQPGDRVNLERAMRLGDRLGGHIVTGHVDGLGQRVAVVENDGAFDVTYAVPAELEPELVQKGSVAIDGVSLTVNRLWPGHFLVTLIPHTVAHTQLLDGELGRDVHLETDVLAKNVRRLMALGWQPAGTR